MKLLRFWVENFRSVESSDWIEADDVTALIGVNESGKTNLLLPLWKLNPAREGELEPTADYPVKMFTDIRADKESYPFITAEFDTRSILSKLVPLTKLSPSLLNPVQVQRYYDGEFLVSFPSFSRPESIPASELMGELGAALKEIRVETELKQEAEAKIAIVSALETEQNFLEASDHLSAEDLDASIRRLQAVMPDPPAKTSVIVPRLQRVIQAFTAKRARFDTKAPEDHEGVHDLIIKSLPKFVYYSSYGNLDSEIYLPHVVENLARADLGQREAARARTLRVLFNFVGLQPKEILELGQEAAGTPSEAQIQATADKKEERSLLLQSAGTKLTKEFRNWWKQGDYRFRFAADGNHFQIWVSDDRRPEEVKLESRSTGLQWFLSFFLVFLVESRGEHANAILLLDEPGHSLHPLAQRDLSAFFANLSKTNQIVYTTHSPFLIDADRLERARKVYIGADGTTKATDNLRYEEGNDRNSGAAYAVHSALNLSISESLLVGCEPVIVEGRADQIYMTTIKTLLISGGLITPGRELVFPPGGGTRTARTVASILTGRDDSLPFMLLDGDTMGLRMRTELQSSLYSEKKELVLNTDDFVGFEKSEIEDLMPPALIADVIDRWIRAPAEEFQYALKEGHPIVPQIEAWANSQSTELPDGWKVELAKRVKKKALADGISKVSEGYKDKWVKLFTALNR